MKIKKSAAIVINGKQMGNAAFLLRRRIHDSTFAERFVLAEANK